MDTIEQTLANWNASLMASIPIGGLLARNPVAYKWKGMSRCWELREAVFWRVTDLLRQSYALHRQRHGLGARILLRSAVETSAVLIYLNQLIQKVLDAALNFHQFGEKTSVLLLGSRDGSTKHQSLNIMTILEKCDNRYPGIAKTYAIYSESAHPNYEGLCWGYSKVDHSNYEINFSNRWMELYGDKHADSMELCMNTVHFEYNDVWINLMTKLEEWVVANDTILEATKDDPLPGS